MWVWSKLSAARWDDAWQERFFWNPGMVITELKGGRSVRVDVYCETEHEAEEIRKQFGGSVRHLAEQNWAAAVPVKKSPLRIRDRLLITPETGAAARRKLEREFPGRTVLSIPPEMAFGTGDHPTTATCLRILVDESRRWRGRKWRLLDLGCGSGVLAMAARRLGAEEALALDYDPKAVEVAEGNMKRNRIENVEVKEADVLQWKPRRSYEIVTANLFSDVLCAAFPMIRSALAGDGRVIVSGILAEQWDETRRAAEDAGFSVLNDWKRGKWMTALVREA
jgi:ribosomal protein L11 methyltransferase